MHSRERTTTQLWIVNHAAASQAIEPMKQKGLSIGTTELEQQCQPSTEST